MRRFAASTGRKRAGRIQIVAWFTRDTEQNQGGVGAGGARGAAASQSKRMH